MSAREIGLFPLAAVLVPGELMPLHIFEERYKRLVRDCEQEAQEFAILYADDDGAREVGCTAEIVEVTERFDDGRLNLVVRGGRFPVELRARVTGRVEPVTEDDEEAAREAASALALYQRVAEATGNEPDPAVTEGVDRMSYAIAARVEFPAAEKLRLLEERSERARLMVIVELLARGLENLAVAAEIRDRAHTNGKVAPPEGGGSSSSEA